uniref:ZP domain-containing protein n=1 Tax=Arion vulgaris TaxID=1028688 RepID=A0A0B7AMN1_9EUPU
MHCLIILYHVQTLHATPVLGLYITAFSCELNAVDGSRELDTKADGGREFDTKLDG